MAIVKANYTKSGGAAKANIRYIQRELQFPYYYFSKDYRFRINKYELGTIIFSKFPIIKTYQTRFNADSNIKTESLIAADIDINHRSIRIYTTHLQSVLFKAKDFRNVEIIRNAEDSMLMASRSLAKKLKGALGLRGYQADTVRRQLDACRVPYAICGDFNDVPNSYTYFQIRGDLQDGLDGRRRHVRLVPVIGAEVAVLTDDQRRDTGRVRRRHRRALHIAVQETRRRATSACALLDWVGRRT